MVCRGKWLILFTVLVFVFVLVGCGTADDSAPEVEAPEETEEPEESAVDEVITLKFSHALAEGSVFGDAYSYFAQAIEEESGGQIVVEVYPSASLVDDPDILDAIMEGTVDMAHFHLSYIIPTISDLIPLTIPGAPPYTHDRIDAFDEYTTPVIRKVFSNYGVFYLGPIAQGSLGIIGKKLVKSPEDLNGTLVRASGKWDARAVELWGGTPMTIPINDVPIALERGTVDLVLTTWEAIQGFKLYESADNLALTTLMPPLCSIMFNEEMWNSLNQEQQDAVVRAWDRYREYFLTNFVAGYDRLIEDSEALGVTVYELSESENMALSEVSETLLEEAKSEVGPDGLELIEAIMEFRASVQ